jgi:hypothetical protein
VFLKYDAWDDLRDAETSRVTATVRNVYLSTDMSALVWCAVGEAPSQARSIPLSLPLSQLRGLTLGKQSRSFVSIASANVSRCFAIVGSNRTLSLEAKSRQARDAFLDALLLFTKRRSLLTGRSCTVVLDGNSRFESATTTTTATLPKTPLWASGVSSPSLDSSPQIIEPSPSPTPSPPAGKGLALLDVTPPVNGSLSPAPSPLSPTVPAPPEDEEEVRHSHPVLRDAKVLEISVRSTGCFRIRGDNMADPSAAASSKASFLVGVFENRANVPQWSFVEHTEKVVGTHDPVFLQKFVLTFVPSWGQQIMLSLYDMTEDGDKARERNRVGSACVDLAVLTAQPKQALSFQLTHFNDSTLDKHLQLHKTKAVVKCTRSRFLLPGEEPPDFDPDEIITDLAPRRLGYEHPISSRSSGAFGRNELSVVGEESTQSERGTASQRSLSDRGSVSPGAFLSLDPDSEEVAPSPTPQLLPLDTDDEETAPSSKVQVAPMQEMNSARESESDGADGDVTLVEVTFSPVKIPPVNGRAAVLGLRSISAIKAAKEPETLDDETAKLLADGALVTKYASASGKPEKRCAK